MKVAVFTGNQARHLALISHLARVADTVFAVQECTTAFPGRVPDFFARSEVMQRYFERVIAAERAEFAGLSFSPANVRTLAIRHGDLNLVDIATLAPAVEADHVVVFGASYIKGPLAERLIAKRAINVHAGLSPYYRGSSCNFWALYDGRPEYVGCTLHLLGKGLDSGAMLRHIVPPAVECDPFNLGMRAVALTLEALAEGLADGSLARRQPVDQDRGRQVRYSRHAEFTDAVAAEYLARLPTAADIGQALRARRRPDLVP